MGNRVQYELDKEPNPAHVVVHVGFRISAIGAFLKETKRRLSGDDAYCFNGRHEGALLSDYSTYSNVAFYTDAVQYRTVSFPPHRSHLWPVWFGADSGLTGFDEELGKAAVQQRPHRGRSVCFHRRRKPAVPAAPSNGRLRAGTRRIVSARRSRAQSAGAATSSFGKAMWRSSDRVTAIHANGHTMTVARGALDEAIRCIGVDFGEPTGWRRV